MHTHIHTRRNRNKTFWPCIVSQRDIGFTFFPESDKERPARAARPNWRAIVLQKLCELCMLRAYPRRRRAPNAEAELQSCFWPLVQCRFQSLSLRVSYHPSFMSSVRTTILITMQENIQGIPSTSARETPSSVVARVMQGRANARSRDVCQFSFFLLNSRDVVLVASLSRSERGVSDTEVWKSSFKNA